MLNPPYASGIVLCTLHALTKQPYSNKYRHQVTEAWGHPLLVKELVSGSAEILGGRLLQAHSSALFRLLRRVKPIGPQMGMKALLSQIQQHPHCTTLRVLNQNIFK